MIAQLGAQKGFSDADVQKILDRLADAEQVAISVRNGKVVVMLTGPVAEQALAAPEPGLKTVPLNNGTILMGHADAVDQAVQRITWKDRLRLLHKLPSSARPAPNCGPPAAPPRAARPHCARAYGKSR